MAEILLAEDSPTHTALMRSILSEDGHEVRCVADGKCALSELQDSLPDLVVTDLRMPEVNGVELVSTIADSFPQLPTIVVTARGSESLAVDALAEGAANFVPKNSLHNLLRRVVQQTIVLAAIDQSITPNLQKDGRFEWSVSMPCHPEGIFSLGSLVLQTLASAGYLNPTHRIRVSTAIISGLFNAICFGNLQIPDSEDIVARLLSGDATGLADLRQRASEPAYRNLAVTLRISISQADTRISINHSGKGRATRMTPAPGTPESFELEQCRGLMLMSSFADELILRGDATEVVLIKTH